MKPSSQSPRTPSRLSGSLHHQLSGYALAASAAGVGMLALAERAEAKIIYTPAHKSLPVNKTFYFDLKHDGTNDFLLFLRVASTYTCCFSNSLRLTAEADNGVVGHLCPTCYRRRAFASA